MAPFDVLGWYALSWHYIEPSWEKVREVIKEDTRETVGQDIAVANGHAESAIAEEETTSVFEEPDRPFSSLMIVPFI